MTISSIGGIDKRCRRGEFPALIVNVKVKVCISACFLVDLLVLGHGYVLCVRYQAASSNAMQCRKHAMHAMPSAFISDSADEGRTDMSVLGLAVVRLPSPTSNLQVEPSIWLE